MKYAVIHIQFYAAIIHEKAFHAFYGPTTYMRLSLTEVVKVCMLHPSTCDGSGCFKHY